jgi:hypothetical protein
LSLSEADFRDLFAMALSGDVAVARHRHRGSRQDEKLQPRHMQLHLLPMRGVHAARAGL